MMTESETLLLWSGRAAKPLPRLVTRGQFFALDTGDYFTAIQCSDFNLLNRWQHGEDIRPILEDRAGFNMLRVWTAFDIPGIGTFLDIDYERLPEFLSLCASYGFYVELCAYTGVNDPNHWYALISNVRASTNVLLELVNELDQNENEPDAQGRVFRLSDYELPTGVLCSHGSNGSEARPVGPFWDYATFHTNDAFEWQRKVGHNAMEIWSGPTLSNENTRFIDRDDEDDHAEDAAAGGGLLCAGSCFHSVSGKTSKLFYEDEAMCAAAWIHGANSVRLLFQDGRYVHRADLEGPDDLRVYQRVLDTGEAETVRIRR